MSAAQRFIVPSTFVDMVHRSDALHSRPRNKKIAGEHVLVGQVLRMAEFTILGEFVL